MPGSAASVFREPEDFETALRAEGRLALRVTGRGRFGARLTRVALRCLRLWTAEEDLSRIAFIAVPADMVLISLPLGTGTGQVYGGIGMQAGEIMTLGPDQQVHARTDGPCRWGAIWVPVKEMVLYGGALTGAPFAIPPLIQRWGPPRAAGKDLHRLHATATRMAETHPQALVDVEAAHGLEQQLIHAVVECLSARPRDEKRPATARRHQDMMVGFERLLQAHPARDVPISEICAALGVSDRLLRSVCAEHLGMSPAGYDRLCRMSLVRRALRHAGPRAASISGIAQCHGFRDAGRFAINYRTAFGELPSATLRRGGVG
jgi:AraC-like DNA-binding protein